MNRRAFCTNTALACMAGLRPGASWAGLDELRSAVGGLNALGSNAGLAALDGQTRELDPHRHYPSKAGVVDAETGHRFFFHAHRDNEFGHFHTFARDRYSAPVHLVMISINAEGRPTALSTVNQWVTGTRHIPAGEMRPHIDGFKMSPQCYKQPDLVRFVTEVIACHRDEIEALFHERDAWLTRYRSENGADPFKDQTHEVLSQRTIDPLKRVK